MKGYTTVLMSVETKLKLQSLKKEKESYDALISRLMSLVKEVDNGDSSSTRCTGNEG